MNNEENGVTEKDNSPDMSSDCPVSIAVDEPTSSGFGPTKYTTYRIKSSGTPGSVNCRHRFSGFVTLRSELLVALPGVVVPPLSREVDLRHFIHGAVNICHELRH